MATETITTSQLDEVKHAVGLETITGVSTKPVGHIILRTIKVFYDSNRYK